MVITLFLHSLWVQKNRAVNYNNWSAPVTDLECKYFPVIIWRLEFLKNQGHLFPKLDS